MDALSVILVLLLVALQFLFYSTTRVLFTKILTIINSLKTTPSKEPTIQLDIEQDIEDNPHITSPKASSLSLDKQKSLQLQLNKQDTNNEQLTNNTKKEGTKEEQRLLYNRTDILKANCLRFLCMFHNPYSVFKQQNIFPQVQINYRFMMLAVLLLHVQLNLSISFTIVSNSSTLSIFLVIFISIIGYFIIIPIDYIVHRVIQFSTSVYHNINYKSLQQQDEQDEQQEEQDEQENTYNNNHYENIRLVLAKDIRQQTVISMIFIVHSLLLLNNLYNVCISSSSLSLMTLLTSFLSLLFDYIALRICTLPIISAVSYLDLVYDPEQLQWMLNHFKQYGYPLKYENIQIDLQLDQQDSQELIQDHHDDDQRLRDRINAEQQWNQSDSDNSDARNRNASKQYKNNDKHDKTLLDNNDNKGLLDDSNYIEMEGMDNDKSVHLSMNRSKFVSSKKRNGRSDYNDHLNSNGEDQFLGSFQQSQIGRTKSLKDTNKIKVLSSNRQKLTESQFLVLPNYNTRHLRHNQTMNLSIDRLNLMSPTKSQLSILGASRNKNTLNFINNYSIDQQENSINPDDTQLQQLNNLLDKGQQTPDNHSNKSNPTDILSESQQLLLKKIQKDQEEKKKKAQQILDEQQQQMNEYRNSLKNQVTQYQQERDQQGKQKVKKKQENLNSAYTSGFKKKRNMSQQNKKNSTNSKQQNGLQGLNYQMEKEPFYNFDQHLGGGTNNSKGESRTDTYQTNTNTEQTHKKHRKVKKVKYNHQALNSFSPYLEYLPHMINEENRLQSSEKKRMNSSNSKNMNPNKLTQIRDTYIQPSSIQPSFSRTNIEQLNYTKNKSTRRKDTSQLQKDHNATVPTNFLNELKTSVQNHL